MIFKPTGTLNVTSDPAIIGDGDMQRCKNLRLDKNGIALTRDGKTALNSTAITMPEKIVEQSGNRYALGANIYKNESSIASGLGGSAPWDAILYNPYNSTTESIYASNTTYQKRIENTTVYKWGIAAPTVAPTIAVGAGAGLTGDYNAKYSYCRKEGSVVVSESNLSDAAAAAVTLANQSLSVSWTASGDSQVTHVRVYRTLAGGSIYYHDQDVAIGTTTVDTTTADASLGTLAHSDHDEPPAGNILLGPNFNGICFMLKDNRVYHCLSKQPDYWPASYYVEAGSRQRPLKSGCFYNNQLYVASETNLYQIAGSGSQTFFPIPQTGAEGGALSRYGMLTVAKYGIFHVLSDGIYLFNASGDTKITHSQLDTIFRGGDAGPMPAVDDLSNCWLRSFQNKLYFGYAADDNIYPRHVIVYGLSDKKMSYYDWGIEIPITGIDATNKRLMGSDTAGYIWHLENGAMDTGCAWDIQSREYTLSTRAHFPRWVKYDVNASEASSATGELWLDGSIHQSHTLSEDRSTRRRLVETGNGASCSIRISGSGPVSIYAVESE